VFGANTGYNKIIHLKQNGMETITKSKSGTTSQKDIVIQRVFDLPVNKVWKALTEAEEFKKERKRTLRSSGALYGPVGNGNGVK
jgi:hypothetical protein